MRNALIAVGGNSLIRAGQKGTIEEQFENARATAEGVVRMLTEGWNVVLSHGNGPQVGAALIRSDRGAGEVYTHTLDMCVATTQSEIGYLLVSAFELELKKAGLDRKVVLIPTRVRVDENDKAFQNPTKPVGPFYTQKDAEHKRDTLGWNVVEDAARGWRRVVPSPEPIEVMELEFIKEVLELGHIVIALGGGGIPVVRDANGNLIGSEAVIDKDRSSALLAAGLNVDMFIISTDADQVYVDYKKPTMRGIPNATCDELQKYYDEGQFPAGSMGPKVESVIRFARNSGKPALITTFECLTDALAGKAGTRITA